MKCEFTIYLGGDLGTATCTADATTVEIVKTPHDPDHITMLCPEHAQVSQRLEAEDHDAPFEYSSTQHLVLEYNAPHTEVCWSLGVAGKPVVAYGMGGGAVQFLRREDHGEGNIEWEYDSFPISLGESGFEFALQKRVREHVGRSAKPVIPDEDRDRLHDACMKLEHATTNDAEHEAAIELQEAVLNLLADAHGGSPVACDECGLPITPEMGDDTCECDATTGA